MKRLILTLTLLSAFWVCPAVYGQSQKADICDHVSDSAERFALVRIYPPVQVTYYDGQKIEFVFADKRGVYVHIMNVEETTVLASDFPKRWRQGLWWVIYCDRDKHIYSISRLSPGQVQKLK